MSAARTAYNGLASSFARRYRIQHASAILEVDAACTMPPGGAPARGAACAELASIAHAELTSAKNIENVAVLKKTAALDKELSPMELANFNEMKRLIGNETCLPAELVAARTTAQHAAEACWRVARKENDFKMFEPHLTKVFALAKEAATHLQRQEAEELKAEGKTAAPRCLYEIMMAEHDPLGFSLAEMELFFADLKQWLPAALKARIASQPAKKSGQKKTVIPVEKQKQLCEHLATKFINFDLQHGVLAVSTHPMTAGVATDVRLTNRFSDDWLGDGVMGVMHEGGHSVAEQGRNKDEIDATSSWIEQPVSVIRGMVIHESQSLLHEMQIGRSLPFFKYLSAQCRELDMGLTEGELEPAAMLAESLRVEPGPIRVEADELSYPLHVMIRFEIEKALCDGSLTVPEIPQYWRDSYKNMLGVDVETDSMGPLQDIHWSLGAYGYFPSYSAGAAVAAQLMATVRRELGSDKVDGMIEKGEIKPIQNILRDRVWRKGSSASVNDILVAATGESFNAKYYKEHLLSRYAPL